ncbi:hypothetical protein [Caulobacter soli]|uniref:hypothetical protein n=1 Tax=Caulobacter soli TaxID=2708539 RepID=UPI0013EDDC61|nr:hypothetical protein [Caulobacter soli]
MSSISHINGLAHPEPKALAAHVTAAASSVYISQTASGGAVNQVKQSTTAANNLYWLHLSNSSPISTLEFIVSFKPGSPLVGQSQRFAFPSPYAGSVTTPFGVPYWGGDPILGPAVLTVLVNGLAVGSYNFTVIA